MSAVSDRLKPTSRYAGLPDDRLVALCLSGAAEAWDELIDRYEALIYSTLLKCGLERSDADDVFQDTALTLYHHLSNLRDTSRLASWLISTSKREAWRLMRRRAAAKTDQMPEHESQTASATRIASPEDLLPEDSAIKLAEQQLVRESMAKLAERCRALLRLLYCDDPPKSYIEVTELLGMPIGSIGPTRARCLQQLRRVLAESGF